MQVAQQCDRLVEFMRQLESCLVAYSGGVDSAVVAKAAAIALGPRAVAVTAVSASLATGELAGACELAGVIGIRHEIIRTEELARSGYAANGFDRCYHCKTELYSRLLPLQEQLRFKTLVNGANVDDLSDYRPGLRAAAEYKVVSPLADLGLTKDDVRAVYDDLVARMADSYNGMMSAPALADANLGPLISAKQKAIVEGYLAKGADLRVAGRGTVLDDVPAEGHYLPATLFADVPPDHPLAQEEIFGPVQVAIPFETEDEAVAIANGTGFGLVASVWTENGARQMRMAKRLRAGQVFVNNYGAGGGVELPFGGTGLSGHGREKGFEALYGFSSLKTVATKYG